MEQNSYRIYPKQFRNVKIPIEKNRCFFIMPFAEDFDIIYGTVKHALNNSEYICSRVDEITGSIPIMNKILMEILKAQFIIVDITGGNPNVFYELGIAHTFKDAQNIFLIKEKGIKVPFDITHLTYLEYEKNNLKFMVSQLKQSMSENKYLSEFYEALNICGIIDFTHDNQDAFIETLIEFVDSDISIASDILNSNTSIGESQVKDFLIKLKNQFAGNLAKYEFNILSKLLNFYYELLIKCNQFEFIGTFVHGILIDFFDESRLDEREITSLKTDFALKYAKANKQLEVVMPWIIAYFKRSKFAAVDLNRYKLEAFLLTSSSTEVNNIMIDAMTEKDCHVREHFADIIGEKQLHSAQGILCKQLVSEENYYTAGSIIGALGKLKAMNAIPFLKNWLEQHKENILNTKSYFVLKQIRITISKIDRNLLYDFDNEYIKYLTEYFL